MQFLSDTIVWKLSLLISTLTVKGYVSVKSKLQIEAPPPPPGQTPGHWTFLKIIVQIPPYPGQNAAQMPHTRVHSGDQMPHPGDISEAHK